jgi:hypothetical protein
MTKNRHELPRKRPDRSKKDDIAEDLPTLEPLADDLPTLEPADGELPTLEAADEAPEPEGPVKVACTEGGEASFDTVLTVDVPAMDKKAVADAVQAPLQRACATNAARLRHRKVLVRFTGDAVVGSAVKDLVAQLLAPHKPLLAVVRRGFGDETVLQGKLPEATVATNDADGALRVDVGTGELDQADLAVALAPHLDRIAAGASGRRVTFVFGGKAKPDAALRAALSQRLQAAGAVRAAIGERVLFDTELARAVRCTVAGDVLTVAVTPLRDDATTVDALSLVLPEHAAACLGRTVRIELASPSQPARDAAVEFARKHGAARIEVGREIVWPRLVTATSGNELVLRLDPAGRDRAQVLAALQAEAPLHAAAAAKGRAVVVDWPAGFALDTEAAAAVAAVAGALGAKALACTIGGEHREPFVPEPVTAASDGDATTVRLLGEAGKPAELQRAVDRRLPAIARGVRGKSVRVHVAGAVAVSRTLLRGVCGQLEAAGAMRLEVEEGGNVDVLLPAMLTVTRTGDVVRVAAMTAGRDAAQQAKALARELDAAALPAGATVLVGPSAAADAVVAATIAKGAARVLLDGAAPVQVHPPLFDGFEKKGTAVRLRIAGGPDEAMVARQLERELPAQLARLGVLAGQTVTLAWPGAEPGSASTARLVGALADKKASKVLLDRGDGKPQQLHPPLPAPAPVPPPPPPAVTAPSAAPVPAAAAAPGATPPDVLVPPPFAAMPGSVMHGNLAVLARRDDAVPPLVVLGVRAGTDPAHVAAVQAELAQHLPRLRGRAVLLVPRVDDQDVPVRKPDALLEALRQSVPAAAAATLVFRGPDAQGRPHFQVLHSTLRALPVGATFADPRARR